MKRVILPLFLFDVCVNKFLFPLSWQLNYDMMFYSYQLNEQLDVFDCVLICSNHHIILPHIMSNNNREIDCAFDKYFVCVLENIMQAIYKKIRVIIL